MTKKERNKRIAALIREIKRLLKRGECIYVEK